MFGLSGMMLLRFASSLKQNLDPAQLQKVIITQAKLTEERKWLSEVSDIPLQQSVSDLDTAFNIFFASCKGKRKGRFRRISQIQ